MSRTSVPALHPVRLGAAIYYNGLRCLGLTAVERRFRDAGLILCYHNVVRAAGNCGDRGLHLPIDRFEEQMRWLVRRYEVVSLAGFVERLATGKSLRSVATVTFDDAYAGVFEHAVPVLHALGMPATVFVVAEAPGRNAGFWWDQPDIVRSADSERRDRWLKDLRGDGEAIAAAHGSSADGSVPVSLKPADWQTIRAGLECGMDLGVHSATHRSLPTLTDDELAYEIVASRDIVHQATGIRPEFFAYPYGLWDPRVRAMVRSAGYRAGLTLEDGRNAPLADPWCLRRINVPAGISGAAFEAWAAGFHGRRRS